MQVRNNTAPRFKMIAIAAAVVCMASLAACGGGGGGSPSPTPAPTPAPDQAPGISAQPAAAALPLGSPVTLSVAANGSGPLAYQWSRNGVAIDGATGTTYTLPALRPDDNGAILRVKVRNAAGSVDSAPVQLAVSGSGLRAYVGAVGEKATVPSTPVFDFPLAIAIDGAGNLIVPDGERLWKVSATGAVNPFAQAPGCVARSASFGKSGNLFIACGHALYKVSPTGGVTLLAGNPTQPGYADGAGAAALFYNPDGLAVDGDDNVYVADSSNHRVRRVSAAGVVTTFAGSGADGSADGALASASFGYLTGLAFDQNGNLIASDTHAIRKIVASGAVTTLAGVATSQGSADGDGASARFYNPRGVTVDQAGNIYVADAGNNTVRKISATGQVSTIAGNPDQSGSADGTGRTALFAGPTGITLDGQGNLYVADTHNGTVRKIAPAGTVTTLAGTPALPATSGSIDGAGQEARFFSPQGIAIDASGNQLLADAGNHNVRKVSAGGAVSTLAGDKLIPGQRDGRGAEARFQEPGDVAVDGAGNLYLLDTTDRDAAVRSLRKVAPDGTTATVTVPADPANVRPLTNIAVATTHMAIAADPQGNYYVASNATYFSTSCSLPDKSPTGGQTRQCDDLNRTAIRRISPSGEALTIFSTAPLPANAPAGSVRKTVIGGIAADKSGIVYFSDTERHVIYKRAASGEVTPFAGGSTVPGAADGAGINARFSAPTDLALDNAGNLYVLDSGNFTVRKITPQGVVRTLAGTAGKDKLLLGALPGSLPRMGGIAVDAAGVLYITVVNGVVKVVPQ